MDKTIYLYSRNPKGRKKWCQCAFPFSGFAGRTQNYGNPVQNTTGREWTLKVWKMTSLPSNICAPILRFHYGLSLSPACYKKTFNNASSFLSGDQILRRIRIPPEYSQHDDKLCFSHGSRASFFIGGTWFTGSPVGLIPGQKHGRCGSKTVYVPPLTGRDPNEYFPAMMWFIKMMKCGTDRFQCASLNSSRCIPLNKACDNILDCEDASDEHPDICAWKSGQIEQNKESTKMKARIDLDPLQVTWRCPKFEFFLEGVRCIDPETLDELSCTSLFHVGRRVRVECKKHYTAPKFSFDHLDLFCNFDGQWIGLGSIYCKKECGVIDELDKVNKNFSWEITIFEDGVETCGGNLIQPTFVLTDGSCVKKWIESPESRSTIHISLADGDMTSAHDKATKFLIKNAWVSKDSEDLADFENGMALIQLGPQFGKNLVNLSKTMTACFLVPPLNKFQLEQKAVVGPGTFVAVSNENCSVGSREGFCTSSSLDPDLVKIGAGLFSNRVETSAGKSRHILQGIFSGTTNDGRGTFKNVDTHANWILDILEANS